MKHVRQPPTSRWQIMSLMRTPNALIPRSAMPLLLTLSLASATGCGLVLARAIITRELDFLFLPWNLFLAWVPLVFTLILRWQCSTMTGRGRLPLVVFTGLLWLLFLPNAPYIVTDLVHLELRHGYPMWADMGMIVLFAGTGFMLGFLSVFHLHQIVKARFGWMCGWLFALGTLSLAGLGVFIGRFLRWNSWDFIVNPIGVMTDVASHFGNPVSNPGPPFTTLLFATICMVAYLTLHALTHMRINEPDTMKLYEHREMDHAL